MDCRDPDKRRDHGARDNDRAFSHPACPACASAPSRVMVILDTRNGKTVRLYECQCGGLLWDD
jgi:formate dehydrogenase maturation protein FdhE